MISIIIASKDDNDLKRCQDSIKETIGVEHEILVTKNKEGNIPLTKVYNDGAKKAQYSILVFLHEDTEFKKKEWGKKILQLLKNKEVGIVGVVGSNYFPENGAWVSPGVPFLKGRIIHPSPHMERDQLDIFSPELGDIPVVAVDGVFIATRKEIVQEIPFDDKIFNGFHFYEADFCIRVIKKYKIITTTDILLKHFSHGKHDEVWNQYKKKFIKKHQAILPYTITDKKPNWKDIKTWQVKYLIYK